MEQVVLAARDLGVEIDERASWSEVSEALIDTIASAAATNAGRGQSVETDVAALGVGRDVPRALLGPVSSLIREQASDAPEATACWIDIVHVMSPLLGPPTELLAPDQAAGLASDEAVIDAVVALPLMHVATAVLERAVFHFPAWELDVAAKEDADGGDKSAATATGNRRRSAAPEHFLDFCIRELDAAAKELHRLVRGVAVGATGERAVASVLRHLEGSLTGLFAERYVAPAAGKAGDDTAPLLHTVKVVGAAVREFHATHAARFAGVSRPFASVFCTADVCSTWIAAERQYCAQALQMTDTASAVAHLVRGSRPSAGENGDWRRQRLVEVLRSTPVAVGSSVDVGTAPFTSSLPLGLRDLGHVATAQIQRAAGVLRGGPRVPPAQLKRCWKLFVDRILVWMFRWWRDALEAAVVRTAEGEALLTSCVSPAEQLSLAGSSVVVPALRAALRSLGAHSDAAFDAIASQLTEELDTLALMSDSWLRQVIAALRSANLSATTADALVRRAAPHAGSVVRAALKDVVQQSVTPSRPVDDTPVRQQLSSVDSDDQSDAEPAADGEHKRGQSPGSSLRTTPTSASTSESSSSEASSSSSPSVASVDSCASSSKHSTASSSAPDEDHAAASAGDENEVADDDTPQDEVDCR